MRVFTANTKKQKKNQNNRPSATNHSPLASALQPVLRPPPCPLIPSCSNRVLFLYVCFYLQTGVAPRLHRFVQLTLSLAGFFPLPVAVAAPRCAGGGCELGRTQSLTSAAQPCLPDPHFTGTNPCKTLLETK